MLQSEGRQTTSGARPGLLERRGRPRIVPMQAIVREENTAMQPDETEIARTAHEMWEADGRPDGKAEEHWHRARAHLSARHAAAVAEPDTAPAVVETQPDAVIPDAPAEVEAKVEAEPAPRPAPHPRKTATKAKAEAEKKPAAEKTTAATKAPARRTRRPKADPTS